MTTAEENFYLLEKIDADRQFLLLAMQSNPALLARAEARIREPCKRSASVQPWTTTGLLL